MQVKLLQTGFWTLCDRLNIFLLNLYLFHLTKKLSVYARFPFECKYFCATNKHSLYWNNIFMCLFGNICHNSSTWNRFYRRKDDDCISIWPHTKSTIYKRCEVIYYRTNLDSIIIFVTLVYNLFHSSMVTSGYCQDPIFPLIFSHNIAWFLCKFSTASVIFPILYTKSDKWTGEWSVRLNALLILCMTSTIWKRKKKLFMFLKGLVLQHT